MSAVAVSHSHEVVSQEAWLKARKAFMAKEKELTRQQDELARQRRQLPWTMVDKQYLFEGPNGRESLADLFAGRSQLIIYHFMLGPAWVEGCKACSFLADHIDATLVHLAHRDTSLVVVSRAPLQEIERFKQRMGWRFQWVSSFGSDFNFDHRVSFTKEELAERKAFYNFGTIPFALEEGPGVSVYFKNENGDVFHTYSAHARGLDVLMGAYSYLDLTPKGRDEEGLAFSMAWVRHHDRYEDGYALDPKQGYIPPAVVPSCCNTEEHHR